jgi:hypothetical protein
MKNLVAWCCREQNTYLIKPGKNGQRTGNSGQLGQLGDLLPQGPNKIPYKLPFDRVTRSIFANRDMTVGNKVKS